jgi:PKHD-type hydroxylase
MGLMLNTMTLQQAFSTGECRHIIDMAQQSGMQAAGLVQGQSSAAIRTAQVAWLDDQGDAAWVMARIVTLVGDANRGFGFDLTDFAERIQVAHYCADDAGHFDWHSDTGTGELAAKRKLTLVVQLSLADDYDGGLLQVWQGNQPVDASQAIGNATIFPSFSLHRVTPVRRGERWSLTTWVHGPQFR